MVSSISFPIHRLGEEEDDDDEVNKEVSAAVDREAEGAAEECHNTADIDI